MNTIEQSKNSNLLGHYSGLTSRLLAFIIDSLVIGVSLISMTYFVTLTWNMLGLKSFLDILGRSYPLIQNLLDFLSTNSKFISGLITFLFIVFYYVILWTFAGQTIGKAVMGIKVVPLKGGRMSFIRSLLRYIGYFISALPIGLGFFWILIDDRRMGWHDRLAGTCVIYAWNARPEEVFLVNAIDNFQARRNAIKNYLTNKKKSSE